MKPEFDSWHKLGLIIKRENLLSLDKVALIHKIRKETNCNLSEAYNIATLLLSIYGD